MKHLAQTLSKEISVFENFFNQFGFKRVDGAVYGLLVLHESPLNASEIEKALSLSQSAVSQSLKVLKFHGAVESRDVKKKERRCQFHTAKEDSLKIVATIFKKRDRQVIEDFQQMAANVLKYDKKRGTDTGSSRTRRINSIISTTKVANAVINFIIELSKSPLPREYPLMANRFPKLLHLLTQSIGPLATFSELKKNISRQLYENRRSR
ncbi:MAG: ArsR family transcriptional regulator [Halobacteriovoraceae bacterium]|nr:ArsR family transcriptional regulator [Halobacteriovoraceae bacterium]